MKQRVATPKGTATLYILLIYIQLLLGVNLQELNLELESLIRADVSTSTTLAISHLSGDPECNLTTNLNELHTLSPTLNNAVERE